MQDLLAQIQAQLGQIHKTASNLPAGTDFKQASSMLGGMTNQVKSVMSNAMPIPADATQAPPPPTFQSQQPPDDLSLKAQIDKQRAELEATYRTQLEQINKQIEEAQRKQAEMLSKQEGVLKDADPLTSPFREELEKSERERLKIEENYFANQALTNELDRLLTESIEMTRKLQTQKVPGLAGLQQSSRMVKAQEGVQSRIAVIEAVMAARNNQIGVATTFIDRSLRNIQQDRQDRLGYLETLFNFYETTRTEEGKKIFNLTQDQKAIIQEQTNLIKQDLARAEKVADRIRDIILNNPTMAHEAGLSLNDTMDEITKKIADYSLAQERKEMDNQMTLSGFKVISPEMAVGKPESELVRLLDANGQERIYWNAQPAMPDAPKIFGTATGGYYQQVYNPQTGQYEIQPITRGTGTSGTTSTPSFVNTKTGEPLTSRQAAELLAKENLSLSDVALANLIKSEVVDSKGKSILNNTDINGIIKQIREETPAKKLSPEEAYKEDLDFFKSIKGTYNFDKKRAEEQWRAETKWPEGAKLPAETQKALDEAYKADKKWWEFWK